VLDRLAQAYAAKGDLKRAEGLYESIPPRRRRSYVMKNLGAIQLEQGKIDKATETLRYAARKDTGNHNIQFLLGKSLEACGQKDAARHAYMRAIDLKRQKYELDFPEAQDRLREVEANLMTSAVLQQSDSNDTVGDRVGTHEHEGVVNHYNSSRGFGFINSSEQKVFFHISAVEDGHTPVVGERVKFVMEQSEKGPRAIRVTVSQISCFD
jgi:cold shock CspA family protein